MNDVTEKAVVPGPAGLPVIGHLRDVQRRGLMTYLLDVSRDYPDGIFKLKFGSRIGLFVTGAKLVGELSDESRFRKMPGPGLRVVRKFAGDGLFTAYTEEPNWGKAHRILLPAFSQRAMRGYFDMIQEVCDQQIAKWAKLAGTDIEVADDMTRLTLDSIAIAGFGHRFNSFQKPELDPFLESLASALGQSLNMITRLPIQNRFAKKAQRQFEDDIDAMNALVDGIIAERRKNPDPDAKDLLNLMLTAIDPETGEPLDDINIRYQVLTFLIAGHETTSGLLTFTFFLLLRHPHVLAQAYAEVDRVLPGDTRAEYAHAVQFEVIERILKEAMRLYPTAPAYAVAPFEDEVVGDGIHLRKDRPITIFTMGLHRDPHSWDRPDEFDIDRWLPEAEAAQDPNAYKPFGSGARACIGRQFAMLEAKLAVAMILQRFAIGDPHGYRLSIKESLSIKPDHFTMRIRERQPHERIQMGESAAAAKKDEALATVSGNGQRLAVLYGTSLGTARDIAEEIAERAEADGFETVVRAMDESFALELEAEDRVLVLVTATYNGRAPDSAVNVEKALSSGHFADTKWPEARFAVLGIGNSQWPNYQAFPKLIDDTLEKVGAQRLIPRAEADGQGDFDGAVAGFVSDLWAALGSENGPSEAAASSLSLIPVDAKDIRAQALPEHAQLLKIIRNDEMVKPADGLWDFAKEAPRPSTRFIQVELPEHQTYEAGDHIAVYARNRPEQVDRVMARLGLDPAMQIRVGGQGGRVKHLPIGETVTVRQLLGDFVELGDTLPRRALDVVAAQTRCPDTKGKLANLSENWQAEVIDKRLSLIDLLDTYPAAELSLDSFVDLSPAIAPRFYSIASSPLVSPRVASLIVGTMAAPAWSGLGEHRGFASTYMQDVEPGRTVFGYVRRPNPPFAPPEVLSTPMVLIGPGTGFAPLRGFIEERAAQKAAGEEVAKSLLFAGCRHPDHDYFCREEIESWEKDGVVHNFAAYSAVEGHPWRYVQDAIWDQRAAIWDACAEGAQIFLCGDGKFMAPAVRDTLIRIAAEKFNGGHEEGSDWLEAMIEDHRFHQDVFGFGK